MKDNLIRIFDKINVEMHFSNPLIILFSYHPFSLQTCNSYSPVQQNGGKSASVSLFSKLNKRDRAQ